jgi:acyl-CoA synthetase (AMP-forming)/AMP-acid ligase II
MTTADTLAGGLTVTQLLLGSAPVRGDRRALIGGPDDHAYSYADLAATIQAAAAGLTWRGLHPRDVVGVQVPDATCYALATHSIRAAGGIPSPIAPGLSVPEIAGQLADCGARMLLTSPPLAAAGLAAADRSWVRQVISFAEAPGAILFDSLLQSGSLRPAGGRPGDEALLPYIRGLDGALIPDALTQQELAVELSAMAVTAHIAEHDIVVTAPPAGTGRAFTALLDHALLSGATVVSATLEGFAATAVACHGTVAIVPCRHDLAAATSLRVLAIAS